MSSFTVGLIIAATVAGLVGGSASTPGRSTSAAWPVEPASVVASFEPSQPYGPGHRGVDLAAVPGQPVRASLDGHVSVAGQVAGRPVVVVEHRDGLRTTYLPVSPVVDVGDRVRQGDVVGRLARPQHCPARDCLHWGARLGGDYVDPLTLVARSVVLLPVSADVVR